MDGPPTVRIKFSMDTGYRLFAAQDFKKDEYIFVEQGHLMGAKFNPADPEDKDCLDTECDAFHAAMVQHPTVLGTTFPELAITHYIADDNHTFMNEALETIFPKAEIRISGEDGAELREYMKQFHQKAAIHEFFREHAFCSPSDLVLPSPLARPTPATAASSTVRIALNDATRPTQKPQYIFSLLSLLSHCCPLFKTETGAETETETKPQDGPNCAWFLGNTHFAKFIGTEGLAIRATRNIKEGEELTVLFPRREKGCDACKKWGKGSTARRWTRLTSALIR